MNIEEISNLKSNGIYSTTFLDINEPWVLPTRCVLVFRGTQKQRNSFNRLAFVMDTDCVACEVGTETVYSSAGSSVSCPHSVLLCFVRIRGQTAIIFLYTIN